jgi:hypothetical protein
MAADPPRRSTRNWAGWVLPLALLFALVADGASRFLSLDGLAIRSWEAMSRNAFTEGGVPFEPSRHYDNPHASGDLAASTNQPRFREYRREIFTTDAAGYRNASAFSPAHPPDAIVVGTSFSVGSGVSDDQTLPVRLGMLTGTRIYNAAGGTPSPERIRALARVLGMKKGGSVILEILEPNGFPERPHPVARLHQECVSRLGSTCLRLKGWLRASPLRIVVQRFYHRLEEDDVWLPNAASEGLMPVPRLSNGTAMLFSERGPTSCPDITDEAARDYFRWFRDELPGFQLLVIFVPGKYSVYGELSDLPRRPASNAPIAPFAQGARAAGAEPCRERIAAAVHALGIPFVDVTEPLRRAARERLASGEYLYFLDDTHWNGHGIDVAARALAARWRLGQVNNPGPAVSPAPSSP